MWSLKEFAISIRVPPRKPKHTCDCQLPVSRFGFDVFSASFWLNSPHSFSFMQPLIFFSDPTWQLCELLLTEPPIFISDSSKRWGSLWIQRFTMNTKNIFFRESWQVHRFLKGDVLPKMYRSPCVSGIQYTDRVSCREKRYFLKPELSAVRY